ncbi:MAG: hypothetical protein GY853_01390 [PVC group bacterium]|nr:hypothetical protein [PVC group bacterium]
MKKKINPRSAKNKGARLQLWVCRKIADLLKIEFNNQDDQCEIHSREMGQSGVDVILRGFAYENFPFDIECKNTEKLSLYKAVEQAEYNTSAERDWLLFHKKNFSEPIVVMDAEVFFKLYGRILDIGQETKID